MAKQLQPKAFAPLNLGDYVRIKHYAGPIGKIVELRGALGPDGASVYRVLVNRRPIELLDNQLEVVSIGELEQIRARRTARRKARNAP